MCSPTKRAIMASVIFMKKIILILSLILMEAGTTRFLFSEELGPVKPRTPSYSKEEIFELWNGNKKGEALEKLDQWMNADRKSPEPWVTAAAIAFNDGRYKRCLKMGEKALEKSPQSAGAYYWRGRAFEAMSNWLDAA